MSFSNDYKKVTVTLSKNKYNKLKDMSEVSKLPLARLVAYSIDKAFDNYENFKIDTKWEDASGECLVGEDIVLLGFIAQSPKGAGVDYMLLYNDVVGLSRPQIKNALKKLTTEKKIKKVLMKTKFFEYSENYEAYQVGKGVSVEVEKTPDENKEMYMKYYGYTEDEYDKRLKNGTIGMGD